MAISKLIKFVLGDGQSNASSPARPVKIKGSSARWYGSGETIKIKQYSISRPMLYAGVGLPTVAGYGKEPSLVNTALPVDSARVNRQGLGMSYWPSYSEISPPSRAAYLEWLSMGRRQPNAYIGYVFLFFYGLERRVLCDAFNENVPFEEVDEVVQEAKCLLEVYGDNRSFSNYCRSFIDAAELLFSDVSPYDHEPEYHKENWRDFPVKVKYALACLSAEGKPVPAKWALAFFAGHPDTRPTTVMKRCWDMYKELFCIRYNERFGDGIVIPPNKSRLKLVYQPASSSFGGAFTMSTGELPDPVRLSGPFNKISDLAMECEADMQAYSRWLNKNMDAPEQLDGVSLLPNELINNIMAEDVRFLADWAKEVFADTNMVKAHTEDIIDLWPNAPAGTMSKRDALGLVQLFGKLGVGVEPDPRFYGTKIKPGGYLVLFKQEEDVAAPSREYNASAVLLHLAAMVAIADGVIVQEEENLIISHLENTISLSDAEVLRLRAHMYWLFTEKPGTAGIKKRLEQLQSRQLRAVANFVVGVAGADGVIDPKEVSVLKKIYVLLGFDENQLFSDLHGLSADASGTGVVASPTAGKVARQEGADFTLDMSKVQEIVENTEAVTDILVDVFEEEDADSATVVPAATPEGYVDVECIEGLDAVHTCFVNEMPILNVMDRADFEQLAAKYGLFPDAVMELVNDVSFDKFDEPLIEGDDPLEVNVELLSEMRQ